MRSIARIGTSSCAKLRQTTIQYAFAGHSYSEKFRGGSDDNIEISADMRGPPPPPLGVARSVDARCSEVN